VRVGLLSGAAEIDSVVCLFEAVAKEKGWCPEGALRETVYRSTYLGLEVRDRLVGGMQIVTADRCGRFPFNDVWPETVPARPGQSAHVAVLAVEQTVRGQGRLFWYLAAEMWRHCVGIGVSSVYIEASPRILPIYRRLGWPLKVCGELRSQWGAPTYLRSLGIPDVAEAILRRAEHSAYYRQIVSQAFRVSIRAAVMANTERRCSTALAAAGA